MTPTDAKLIEDLRGALYRLDTASEYDLADIIERALHRLEALTR